MRNSIVILLFALITIGATAQTVYFDGDSVHVETPEINAATHYQFHIQNLDALWEDVVFNQYEATGVFFSPWCNVRVSRTAVTPDYFYISELSEDLKKVDVLVQVSAMPNRKIQVEVYGGEFSIQVRHIAYGSWLMLYENGAQYFPKAENQQPGKHIYNLPYRLRGVQVATVVVHAGQCSQSVGRIIHLN